MTSITLQPLFHKNAAQIALIYDNKASLNTVVKKIKGVQWSQTNKCWYLPLSRENYNAIVAATKDIATLDTTALKQYLIEKNKTTQALPPDNIKPIPPVINKKSKQAPAPPAKKNSAKKGNSLLCTANQAVIESYVMHLKLHAYSDASIVTYRNEFMQLLQKLGNRNAADLTVEDLKRYMLYAMEKEGITENTAHSRLNALKYYYEQVLGREKFFWEIPRPKKKKQLPKHFNQDEISNIINSVGNLKHKVMLMLAYSAGLRVSEVVELKAMNIDSKRMCILLEDAKGKKDRVTPLSPVLLVMLREYYTEYKPQAKGYLFEGQYSGTHYSTRSLQSVIQVAKEKANVIKPGSIHALRHSFATHLLDKGTDITMIMKLLGHNDLKTTLRYLHVTNRDMLKIISPLDDLNLK
jgi:site-specific recombinase XerD